ncbi:MAG: hypothetical protein AABY64_09590 [Bdellovibrionota bacterium]
MELKNNESSILVNQWIALNRFLFIYKAVGVAITGLCLLLGVVCIFLANKSPVVILASENDYLYFQGHNSQVALTEIDIKRFVEKFVTRYYNWSELNPDLIIKNIEPLATDGFKINTLANLKFRKEKEFLGKKIQQSVAGISVQITKESTVAIFDVVLRVEGIPLIVTTQVAFQLVKGAQTEWNPMGLYVNSLTMHEGK